jgi:hypothetical protein
VKQLARLLERWPIALAAVAVLAAALLLPGLGSFGLWEPQERQVADRQAPRRAGTIAELDAMIRPAVVNATTPKPLAAPLANAHQPEPAAPPPLADDKCLHAAPHDAVARSLTARAAGWGRDLDDSDAGRRLPFALLGLLAVLATAGIAMRTAGPRAGVITALVLLSMPLLSFQARQLTSEIGTAAGGALILYGLVALGRPPRGVLLALADQIVAAAALVLGIAVGFLGGGALLGLLVPIGAFAAAGALGVPAVIATCRELGHGAIAVAGAISPRFAVGRERAPRPADATPFAETPPAEMPPAEMPPAEMPPAEMPPAEMIKALVATLVALGLIGLLAYELYSLRDPQPGQTPPQREVLDHAIVPTGCWSPLLGAVWRAEDDLKYIYDSTFEQIAYGTFPWGLLAPIAIGALVASKDRARRGVGALALAWAGAAWIASEAFQRKVGFTLYAGFPALALGLGVWLDHLLVRGREEGAARLVALYAVLGVLVLGKDMQSFADRLPSLLVGGDTIPYPKLAHLALLPTKLWVLVLGLIVALAFALAISKLSARVAQIALATTLGATALVAAFWPFAWQPNLATHLSSKAMFETLLDLAHPGDSLVVLGDLGDAPHDYAPVIHPEALGSREQIVQALARPNRVFAIAPQSELCQLHHDMAHKPYFVLDDRNARSLLVSNRVDGAEDLNPLRDKILHEPPATIRFKPKGRVVFDGRIELLGWDLPRSVGRGSKFEVKLYFKVLQPVGGAWRIVGHFDGPSGMRFNGDHEPIDARCQTSQWAVGDYIVDTNTVVAGGPTFPDGTYEVWTGFFTGTNPNFKNMPVTEAPPDMRDQTDRVKIATISVD